MEEVHELQGESYVVEKLWKVVSDCMVLTFCNAAGWEHDEGRAIVQERLPAEDHTN